MWIGPASLPRLAEIQIDPAVLLFTLVTALASGLSFGLLPVLRHVGPRISQSLRGGGRTVSQSRERHRTSNALAVVQVALALILLIASGLMIRTFQELRAVRPGFTQPEQVQLVRLSIPPAQVSDPEQVVRLQQSIRDRIATLPGVTAASFANAAPLEPDPLDNLLYVDGQAYAEGQIPPDRRFKFVSPGFFEVVGIPLVAGRDLQWTDLYERRSVAIVSENFAREMWREPSQALGKRIRVNHNEPWRDIIGVVGNVHDDGVHERAPTTVYWPAFMANFQRNDVMVQRSAVFAIRSTRAGQDGFLKELSETIWAINPRLPLAQVRTLGELYQRSLARTSFALVMLAFAGGTALLLALVGIYGVISCAVTQRTREIGIRLALGAPQTALEQMFVRHGLRLAAVGISCGLAGAVMLTRLMSTLLFGINALDYQTYGAVSLVLIAAVLIASYVPARRAATVDPVIALRAE